MSQRTHTVDDYLETIYFLASPHGEYRPAGSGARTLAARVAEMLGLTRATVGEALRRMEADGLIERGREREALLTAAGNDRAQRLARRHRLLERLLTDVMGLTPAESHERADAIGDPFTDLEIDRMAVRLGDPERCPHGWPVDSAVERAEDPWLRRLTDVGPGTTITIVRLLEHDGDLLRWFYAEGFVPGETIEVMEIHPGAQTRVVTLGGTRRDISDTAARGLLVRT